ncbi:unnamed protein product [Haemonchus placei]|uniref:Serine protease K12H4.7 n=1 Tax=Haemonchus placei TaxID=6290 RepID=A0A0N4X6A3_HAEPC|nr:unnamed protein product [Haemonchus placei]
MCPVGDHSDEPSRFAAPDGFWQAKSENHFQQLLRLFSLCQDLNPADVNQIEYFWQNVYSPYMYVGLYANELTIKNAICRFHETQDNSLTKLREVNNYVHQMMGSNGCMYVDYWNLVKYLQDTRYGQAQDYSDTAGPFFGGKSALPVQVCSESKILQCLTFSTDPPFLRHSIDECTHIFGSDLNSATIAAHVAHINDYYGGRNMKSSYIILPNGNIDPWHALGKLNSTISTIVPVVIDGAAHCADMYPSTPNDSPAMTEARKTIATTLQQWLQSAK